MKTYANFVYMGNMLAQCPDVNPVIYGVYTRLFKPRVKIVEEDCGTRIGSNRPVNANVVGSLEVGNTDTPIIASRVSTLLQQNKPFVPVRSVESCVSQGGICRKCLHGSYEYIDPDYDKTTLTDVMSYPSLTTVPAVDTYLAMDFTGEKSLPYLTYLSNTYSGQILGLRSYLTNPLPLREGLLRDYIPDAILPLFVREVTDSGMVQTMELNYANSLSSKLEKTLFLFSQYFLGYYSSTP